MAKTFFANGQRYDVEDADIPRFKENAAAGGFEVEEGQRYRTDDGHVYNLPASKAEGFRESMPSAARVIPFKRDEDEKESYMTMGEVSQYLRSPEYRARHKGDAEQHSPAWAGVKGALGGFGEGLGVGMDATANKLVMAVPEVVGSIAQAAGNTINGIGTGHNAVGDWLANAGQNFAQGVKDYAAKVGINLNESVSDQLGYEDLMTKAADFGGEVSKTAVKFAPGIARGLAGLANLIFGSDAINAATDIHDLAKENGFSEPESVSAGSAAALISFFGAKGLTKFAPGWANIFKNPLMKFTAGAAATGATMGVQNAAMRGVENLATRQPFTEGMGEAFGKGETEGVLFHTINGLPGAVMEIPGYRRARAASKQEKAFVRDAILDAAESKDGAALLNTLMDGEGLQAAEAAVREGKPISRSVGRRAGLPDNMSAEERTKVISAVIDAKRNAEAERAKAEDIRGRDPLAAESEMRRADREAETARHEERQGDIETAFKDADAARKEAEAARVERDREITAKRQQEIAEQKRQNEEWERAERERIERERAEQDAAPTMNEERNRDYHDWLKRQGRKDTDKNFRKWQKDNEIENVTAEDAEMIRGKGVIEAERAEGEAKAAAKKKAETVDALQRMVGERESAEADAIARDKWEREQKRRADLDRRAEERRRAEDESLEANEAARERFERHEARQNDLEAAFRDAEAKRVAKEREATLKRKAEIDEQKRKSHEYELEEWYRKQREQAEAEDAPTMNEERNRDYHDWLKRQGRKDTDKNFRKWQKDNEIENVTAEDAEMIRGKGVIEAERAEGEAKAAAKKKAETVDALQRMVGERESAEADAIARDKWEREQKRRADLDRRAEERRRAEDESLEANEAARERFERHEARQNDLEAAFRDADERKAAWQKENDQRAADRADAEAASWEADAKARAEWEKAHSQRELNGAKFTVGNGVVIQEGMTKSERDFLRKEVESKSTKYLEDALNDRTQLQEFRELAREELAKRKNTPTPVAPKAVKQEPSAPAPAAPTRGKTKRTTAKSAPTAKPTETAEKPSASRGAADDKPILAKSPDAEMGERVDLRRLDPKRRSDQKVLDWARRKGRTISDGKVTPDAVREYDAQMAKGAAKAARRWFPDMNIVYHDYGESIKRGQHDIVLRDTSGRALGWFEPGTKNVHLLPGANAETVAHEIMWHGTRDWATKRAAAGDARAQKLLDMMHDVEKNAPEDLKKMVRRLYRDDYKGDADLLHNEFGAWLTMGKGGRALEEAMAKAENRTWYAKAFNAVKELFKDFLTRHGKNTVDLSKIDGMGRDEFVDFLAKEFAGGKTLGKIGTKFGPTGEIATKETLWQKARRKIYDVNAALRDMQRDIEKKTGKKLSDDENAEMANALTPGLREAAVMNVRGKLAGYRDLLKKTGISDADAQYYMALKAAAGRDAKVDAKNLAKLDAKAAADVRAEWGSERVAADEVGFKAAVEQRKAEYREAYQSTNGSHISPVEAKRMLAELENGEHAKGYAEIRDYLRDVMDETLDAQVKAGLISKEVAARYRLDEPDYIPFKNEFDEATGEFNGRGMNLGRPEHYEAKGRSSSAGDITAHIFGDYQRTLLRGIETDVRSKLANLVRANPELGTVEKLAETNRVREKTMSDRKDKGNLSGDPNVVLFKQGGDTYAIRLNGERGAAIAAAMTERNVVKWNGWFPKFARASAALATRWSPTFSVRNFTKDNVELANIVFSEKGAVEGAKWVGHYLKSQKDMAGTLARYITTGKIDVTTEAGRMLKSYIDNGGLISGGATEGYDAIKQSFTPEAIAKEMNKGNSKAKVIAHHTLHAINYLNEFAEMTTRVNAYVAERKSGATEKQAALFSRRATVDFNRKGENTGVTNIVRLFSNSTLGATARATTALARSKYGKGMAAALFANGFAQAALEYYMNADEDKRREKTGEATGKDMSEYERKTSLFYVRNGDNVYKVAQHESPFSLFNYAGNCAFRFCAGQMSAKDMAKNLGVSVAELAYHFTGMGDINLTSREGDIGTDAKAALVSGLCPSALQPIAEMLVGVDYKGDPLYKRNYSVTTPNSEVSKTHTPEYAKTAAAWMNEATGGNEARKGYVDVHPESVQKFVEGFGKNAARDVMQAIEVGRAILKGDLKSLTPRDIPIKRDFVRPLDGNTARFYDAYNDYKADKDEFKKRKDWTPEEKREFRKAHPWVDATRGLQVDKVVDRKNTQTPRSGFRDMGINQLRKFCDGYVLRKDGSYVKPTKKPVTDAEKEAAKKELLRKQALVVKRMGK